MYHSYNYYAMATLMLMMCLVILKCVIYSPLLEGAWPQEDLNQKTVANNTIMTNITAIIDLQYKLIA